MSQLSDRLMTTLAIIMIGGALSGCSLAGKRRYIAENKQEYVQIAILNGRGFDNSRGRYLLAVYDDELPDQRSLSLLQLYSLQAGD